MEANKLKRRKKKIHFQSASSFFFNALAFSLCVCVFCFFVVIIWTVMKITEEKLHEIKIKNERNIWARTVNLVEFKNQPDSHAIHFMLFYSIKFHLCAIPLLHHSISFHALSSPSLSSFSSSISIWLPPPPPAPLFLFIFHHHSSSSAAAAAAGGGGVWVPSAFCSRRSLLTLNSFLSSSHVFLYILRRWTETQSGFS